MAQHQGVVGLHVGPAINLVTYAQPVVLELAASSKTTDKISLDTVRYDLRDPFVVADRRPFVV